MGVGDFANMDHRFDSFRGCVLTDGFWGIIKEIVMILIEQWEREKKESVRKFVEWFLAEEENRKMSREDFDLEYSIFLEQEELYDSANDPA